MSRRAREELVTEIAHRYAKTGKKEKGESLTETVKNTGYNRKYLIGKLRKRPLTSGCGNSSLLRKGKEEVGGSLRMALGLSRVWASTMSMHEMLTDSCLCTSAMDHSHLISVGFQS